jgi:enamine deaminase RidA (YjgF/YER057c/UK114 family)
VSPFELFNPDSLGVPRGWTNGVLAPREGRLLFVAGQAGWETGAPGEPPPFPGQFARALDKILVVVRAAGGEAADVARLTVFVRDMPAYLEDRRALREVWQARFGTYYPAMALVEVKSLVDDGALVEIEATAVIGGRP